MKVIELEFMELEDDGHGGLHLVVDTTDYSRQDAWLAKWPHREDISAETLWFMLADFRIAIEDQQAALQEIAALQPFPTTSTAPMSIAEREFERGRQHGRAEAAQIARAALPSNMGKGGEGDE